ncbi:MAG: hypothetical protein ACOX0B_00960 [Minisyncoccales bacterium]
MQAVAPTSREEGELIYFNTGEVAKDEGLKLGETQCYSAWGYNIDSDTYSTDYASACILVDLNIVEVEGYLLNTTKYVRANINTIGLLADLDLRYKKASNTEWTYLPKKKDVSSGLYTFEINNLEPGGVEYDFEVVLAAGENERTYTSSFVSEIVIPTISNALITSNNAESVDMSFDLNNGGALTNVIIEYADNIEFNNSIIITKENQLSGKIKETFTNLIQETTYYYRITGENEKGISNVFEDNFKTESIVKNIEAKNILTSTSEIHFFLNTNHTENTLTIEYADNIEFIDSNIITIENQTYGEGIQTLDNLISNTTYYYKIIAEGKEYPNETNVNSFETLEIEIKASDIIIPREASKTLSFTVFQIKIYIHIF